MISPEQFVPGDGDADREQRRLRIEEYFDGYLKRGQLNMPMTRGAWLFDDTEHVLQKYRSAGWIVTGRGPWTFARPASR